MGEVSPLLAYIVTFMMRGANHPHNYSAVNLSKLVVGRLEAVSEELAKVLKPSLW